MSDARILSELFTSGHLQQLAWYRWSETLSASVGFLKHAGLIYRDSPVADVLDAAFKTLFREHPIEYVYKACILKKTIFGIYSPNTTALYMEFPVADARADMLLVNGDATVFEIKTRLDDPKRLNIQLAEYYRCFRSVCVVVDESQSERYTRELPAHVGISALTSRYSMSVRREPRQRPKSSIIPTCSRYYAKKSEITPLQTLVWICRASIPRSGTKPRWSVSRHSP